MLTYLCPPEVRDCKIMELERRGLMKNLDEEAVRNVNDIVNIEPGCHRKIHLLHKF